MDVTRPGRDDWDERPVTASAPRGYAATRSEIDALLEGRGEPAYRERNSGRVYTRARPLANHPLPDTLR